MADLTPAELAKLDQIHSAVMDRLTALVSSAVDGIRTEGEPFTASTLAGQAQATDHTSVSTLFAAALIRLARHQIADEKRRPTGEVMAAEQGWVSKNVWADGGTAESDHGDASETTAIRWATRRHYDHGFAHSIVLPYTDTTYRTFGTPCLELGTKPEATP